MGSFEGHILPGSLFGMVGLWHLLNCIFNYVKDSKGFCCRVWHPPAWCAQGSRLRYVELYIIIVGSFIDMCVEFFYSTHRRFVVDGALNTAHLNDFEHSAMLLMFFLFAVSALVSEATGYVLAFSLAIFLFFGAGGWLSFLCSIQSITLPWEFFSLVAVAIRLERGHSQTGFAIVDTHLACTCRLSIRFANQDPGFLFADSSHFICIAI